MSDFKSRPDKIKVEIVFGVRVEFWFYYSWRNVKVFPSEDDLQDIDENSLLRFWDRMLVWAIQFSKWNPEWFVNSERVWKNIDPFGTGFEPESVK